MSPPQESVTVVDPRHPLFGRTFPCLGIANSSHRGRCCIVWLRPTVERHVPVAATNLEYDPATLFPLPIAVDSFRQLLHEFACATRASEGEQADGDATTTCFPATFLPGGSSSTDPATHGLANTHWGATNNRAPGARHHVPGMSRAPRGGQR